MEWRTYARHLAMQIWFDLDVCYYSKDAISCHMVLRESHALLVYLCIDVNRSTNSLQEIGFLAQMTRVNTL